MGCWISWFLFDRFGLDHQGLSVMLGSAGSPMKVAEFAFFTEFIKAALKYSLSSYRSAWLPFPFLKFYSNPT